VPEIIDWAPFAESVIPGRSFKKSASRRGEAVHPSPWTSKNDANSPATLSGYSNSAHDPRAACRIDYHLHAQPRRGAAALPEFCAKSGRARRPD
jgi:hypothetical protein